MKTQKGFTLVELMIVVVIIGILSAVAVPSYRDYVIRGRIPDATSNLATKRVQMEQFFQDSRTYATATTPCSNTNAAGAPLSQYFTFSCTVQNATAYIIQAQGSGPMDGFTYTINQDNTKTSTITAAGWTGSDTCWVTKKGGAC